MAHVCIIIAAYNAAPFLRDAIDSALAQDGPDIEVLVVDDGSIDDTLAIARSYPGVRALTQPNQGDGVARDAGLRASESEFVLFLDADDILLPGAVRAHLAAFAAGIDMVLGSNDVIDARGAFVRANPLRLRRFSGRDVALGLTPCFSQCMYRRAALERAGGVDGGIGPAADHDLHFRLLGRREAGLCHGEKVMLYRLHPSQQTKSPTRLYRSQMAAIEKNLGPGGPMEDAELLRAARRHWARYYGQFIPQEILRALRTRRMSRAMAGVAAYLGNAPDTLVGTARFVRKRLAPRAGTRP
ncbi:glycosyltransferase family 2 protein [Rubellimicrobium aerolatum]|uniref:Glycosyltransferase family 2 protein n=1 Tax=Rubellimicrobium aerolatum TaxID=490979 RepID=A0ABW0SB57_9RHOB|nr:glycosyltransferase family 2 protein [Rubellimicrobium aerolatum]MBP1805433.1 glycosyltransferase involved in cell wall biosynthesis [Rubellimicrobium aerolatum]